MQKLLLINGPNLNLLGSREPQLYGSKNLAEINAELESIANNNQIQLACKQSNFEGELIDLIHQAKQNDICFMIINAASLAHTSLGIRDAMLAVQIPFIEVHISNVFKREQFRHNSYLADIAVGCIYGLGTIVYQLALTAAISKIANLQPFTEK